VNFIENLKETAGRVVHAAKDEKAAHDEKAESDIAADAKVAGSRAGTDGDGTYVGRTNPQFDAEVQQSGAEARSEADRQGGETEGSA
jgi:hypothetical protein